MDPLDPIDRIDPLEAMLSSEPLGQDRASPASATFVTTPF
jgi:hypothetical protein